MGQTTYWVLSSNLTSVRRLIRMALVLCSHRFSVCRLVRAVFEWFSFDLEKEVSLTVCYLFYRPEVKKIMSLFPARLFTAGYFSVRSSRSSALRYGWPSGFQCPESKPNQTGRTEKRSILTILRKHRGLLTVYYATKENPKKKKASFDCPIDTPLAIVNRYEKINF